MQFSRRLIRSNLNGTARQYRTGVETNIHLHNAHTRFRIAGFNGALDRRGTAPSGQQRCVHIQASQLRCLKNRCRQNQSIRNNDRRIQMECREIMLCFGGFKAFWRANLDTGIKGSCMHGARTFLLTAPSRPWRLSIDTDNIVTC